MPLRPGIIRSRKITSKSPASAAVIPAYGSSMHCTSCPSGSKVRLMLKADYRLVVDHQHPLGKNRRFNRCVGCHIFLCILASLVLFQCCAMMSIDVTVGQHRFLNRWAKPKRSIKGAALRSFHSLAMTSCGLRRPGSRNGATLLLRSIATSPPPAARW